MRRKFFSISQVFALSTFCGGLAVRASAQTASAEVSSSMWPYLIFIMIAGGLGAVYFLWRRSNNGEAQSQYNYQNRHTAYYENGSYDMERVDAEKELEWLRKSRKSTPKAVTAGPAARKNTFASADADDMSLDTRVFQEKMRKLQYTQLPINSFSQLAPAKRYKPLAVSEDTSLLTAIEQVNEEYEEDESVRDLAVRILTAFRNRNSVDALAQIALYDLSANLRSKAVNTLADFDHESVFETILLACADPTREVRAAAARGLFRLSFDRAHAWKRILEANDHFRMSHAARAAVEASIVSKSFDRLIHEEVKIAYEAFALVSLLIKAGETTTIFEALRDHKDERVKYALLHVIKVHKDERTLDELNKLRIQSSLSQDLTERIRDTVKSFEQVATWSGGEI